MYSPSSSLHPPWFQQSHPEDPNSPSIPTDRLLYPDVVDHIMNQYSHSSTSLAELPSMWNEPSPLTDLSPSPSIPLDPVKLEPCSRPPSPHFIIEPLLSSLAVHKSTSLHVMSHRRSQSLVTQSELAEQLLISQSLAPPTQVPLRATHASSEMLEMMGSFRLNPFAFHTKHKGAQREDMYLTWCGEEPKPLEEEPCMFEWQLEGYCGGILEDLSLIIMDDASSAASDSDSSSFHDSSMQLPFPSAVQDGLSSISSSNTCHRTPFTPPTSSPGRRSKGTPELPVEPSELDSNVNDRNTIGISAHDSADARFRLPAASFLGFPGVSWNQSQSDSFYSPSVSSSTSSPQSSCYPRSSPSECQAKPHNYISRLYPAATERGRSQSYPRINVSGQQSEPVPHRGPIEYMFNRPGCGVNTSRSVTTPSSWPPACSDKIESRNEAASQQAHLALFSNSKITSSYRDRYQDQPWALDNHSSTSTAIGLDTIGLPSLPVCLSNGSSLKRPSSSSLASWQIPPPESNNGVGCPARTHWSGEQTAPLQRQSILCKRFTDGSIQYSTSYGLSSSYPPDYGNTGLVLPKAMPSRQSSSPITTIPTAVELYASRQPFDTLSSPHLGKQNITGSSRSRCTDSFPNDNIPHRHVTTDWNVGIKANCTDGYSGGSSGHGLTSRNFRTFPHHGMGFYV